MTHLPPIRPQTPPPLPARQEPPRQGTGCMGTLLNLCLIILFGVILHVIATVVTLEQLEIRHEFFRALEKKTGVTMPETLKAAPTIVANEEDETPRIEPVAENPLDIEPGTPAPPTPKPEEPTGENPFVIE